MRRHGDPEIQSLIAAGDVYALVTRWAAENGAEEVVAVCMFEAGVLERVETTTGPACMLIDGISFEEAKQATRAWCMTQNELRPWVLEALK